MEPRLIHVVMDYGLKYQYELKFSLLAIVYKSNTGKIFPNQIIFVLFCYFIFIYFTILTVSIYLFNQ